MNLFGDQRLSALVEHQETRKPVVFSFLINSPRPVGSNFNAEESEFEIVLVGDATSRAAYINVADSIFPSESRKFKVEQNVQNKTRSSFRISDENRGRLTR